MITLETTNVKTHITYEARFHTEAQAIAFIDRKSTTSVFTLDETINHIDFPALFEKLFPSCEHGLSDSLCAGPQHYPTHM